MTPKTRLTLVALSAFSLMIPVTAANAQRIPVGGSSTNTERPDDAKPQGEVVQEAESADDNDGKRKFDVSKGAQKAIVALQEAVNANNQAAIPGLIAEAKNKAKTADDHYIIGANQARAANAAGDLASEMAGYDAMNASGSAVAVELSSRYANLGQRALKAGQMPIAESALNKAIELDSNNDAALALLADIRNRQGNKADAVDLMAKSLAASVAKGKKPAEGNFMFAAGLAYDLRSPKAIDIVRDWIRAYPSSKSWRDGLRIYRDLNRPPDTHLLDLMRLAHAANALAGESDYHSYLTSLAKAGRVAEGRIVLTEAGKAEGVDVKKQAFVDVAKRLGKAPTRSAIDAAVKAAKASAKAEALLNAGDDLYGVGAYAEAAELYRAAAAAGAAADLANLRLGMALARAGDAAAAKAALATVAGDYKPIADYWLIYVDTSS